MDVFGLGPMEVLLILIIALIIFGPGRLPEIGAGIGRAIREFRKATSELTRDITGERVGPVRKEPVERAPHYGDEDQNSQDTTRS